MSSVGSWSIDVKTKPGILMCLLEGVLTADDIREFVAEHNAAVDEYGVAPYRVFVDIRQLAPLSPEATALIEVAKAYSAARMNFQGSAVLVSGSLVALQHRRTSASGGVGDTELISEDEAACWDHLRRVTRRRSTRSP